MTDYSNSIADIRKTYKKKTLDENDVVDDPIEQFKIWWDEAIASHLEEANAMTLATATKAGKPSARTVLLKGIHENGFVFYTNYESRKGMEIAENPLVAVLFFWEPLERQVRIEGSIQKVNASESDIYFNSRPVESRLGAWTSPQSKVIPNRKFLDEKEKDIIAQFQNKEVPRPQNWGGYLVIPERMEYWQGRPGRLHDRILYTLDGGKWKKERLAP